VPNYATHVACVLRRSFIAPLYAWRLNPMRIVRLILLLAASYIIAAGLQIAVLAYFTGEQHIIRMAWDSPRTNFLLLLALAPNLSFDILVAETNQRSVAAFSAFFIPFIVCVLASAYWVFRKPRNRNTGRP
jgi:hypothetical protein